MVKAKLGFYYTFRLVATEPQILVHALKWEEMAEVPAETYKVKPNDHSPMGGCSCPAWTNNCKHMKCVREAITSGKINELYKWQWTEKGGWQELTDIKPIDEWNIGDG